MGIRGLIQFLSCKVENGSYNINVGYEIEAWKLKHPKKNPLIIIDFSALMHATVNTVVGSLNGGNCQKSVDNLRTCLSKFQCHGVDLVFLEDGPAQEQKLECKKTQKNMVIKEFTTLLGDVYAHASVEELKQKYANVILRNSPNQALNIRLVCMQYGEMFKAYYNECDKEIAKYAIDNEAMAVIANDSDFLIYPGNWRFWNLNELFKKQNLASFTTKEYNRQALKSHLHLDTHQMAIFATLCGNDIMSLEILSPFHLEIKTQRTKFHDVANFINADNSKLDSRNLAAKISSENISNTAHLIAESMMNYNLDLTVQKQENEYEEAAKQLKHGTVYEFLKDLPISHSVSCFDIKRPEYQKCASAAFSLTQRMMGVVLQHKKDPDLRRRIFSHQTVDTGYDCNEIKPIIPLLKVPHLKDLYDANQNEHLETTKFKLLAWMISDKLTLKVARRIDKEYFNTVLTLLYLVEQEIFTVAEADLFLCTIHPSMKTQMNEWRGRSQSVRIFNYRAFQLPFMFDKINHDVFSAICAVGLPHLLDLLRFDGFFFHFHFDNFMAMPEAQRNELLRPISYLRVYCNNSDNKKTDK